jgi:hypothetical protein
MFRRDRVFHYGRTPGWSLNLSIVCSAGPCYFSAKSSWADAGVQMSVSSLSNPGAGLVRPAYQIVEGRACSAPQDTIFQEQ